jgi:hypothetical protein
LPPFKFDFRSTSETGHQADGSQLPSIFDRPAEQLLFQNVDPGVDGRIQMMPKATDGPGKLDQAKEAVQAATETVRETTQSVANAIDANRKPGAPLDRLARWAREAPLHAVTVAFLIGVLAGRRRG